MNNISVYYISITFHGYNYIARFMLLFLNKIDYYDSKINIIIILCIINGKLIEYIIIIKFIGIKCNY